MKNIAVLIVLLLISCKNASITSNESITSIIDKLPTSEIIYGVKTSNNHKKDTVSIENRKFYEDGQLAFKQIENKEDFTTTTYYYRKNEELYLRLSSSANGTTQFKFETFTNESEEITKAQLTNYENGAENSFYMIYDHNYSLLGKHKSVSIKAIKSGNESEQFIRYNELEKPEFECITLGPDTLECTSYVYHNEKLRRAIIINNQFNQTKVVEFDEVEKIKKEEAYYTQDDQSLLTEKTTFEYNNSGKLIKKETKNLLIGQTVMIKYISHS